MASSVPRSGAPVLVERDAELAALYDAVREAARHEGSVVLVQGPAGAGKTALLRAGRECARAEGLRVLAATGSELDRSFAFGLVHQPLDGVLAGTDAQRRERLLAGAASLVGLVLDPSSGRPEDPSHAALQGLYWLCANLAEEAAGAGGRRPALGRRSVPALPGVPGATAGGLGAARPGCGALWRARAEQELLAALAAGPAARVLRPAALSEEGTGQVLADALGHAPDAAFVGASREATGGNPLLLARTNQGSGQGNRYVRYLTASAKLGYAQGTSDAFSTAWLGDVHNGSLLVSGPGISDCTYSAAPGVCTLQSTGPLTFTSRR